MRLASAVFIVNPTSAARALMRSRLDRASSAEIRYFPTTCSSEFSPPGFMSGFSSKGWKVISGSITPRPIAHQGHAISDTKSIFIFCDTLLPFRWLPEFNLVALRVDNPAKLAVLGVIRLLEHVAAFVAQCP